MLHTGFASLVGVFYNELVGKAIDNLAKRGIIVPHAHFDVRHVFLLSVYD